VYHILWKTHQLTYEHTYYCAHTVVCCVSTLQNIDILISNYLKTFNTYIIASGTVDMVTFSFLFMHF
jgi:hypothetical protein